jgi:hypothetical protein
VPADPPVFVTDIEEAAVRTAFWEKLRIAKPNPCPVVRPFPESIIYPSHTGSILDFNVARLPRVRSPSLACRSSGFSGLTRISIHLAANVHMWTIRPPMDNSMCLGMTGLAGLWEIPDGLWAT